MKNLFIFSCITFLIILFSCSKEESNSISSVQTIQIDKRNLPSKRNGPQLSIDAQNYLNTIRPILEGTDLNAMPSGFTSKYGVPLWDFILITKDISNVYSAHLPYFNVATGKITSYFRVRINNGHLQYKFVTKEVVDLQVINNETPLANIKFDKYIFDVLQYWTYDIDNPVYDVAEDGAVDIDCHHWSPPTTCGCEDIDGTPFNHSYEDSQLGNCNCHSSPPYAGSYTYDPTDCNSPTPFGSQLPSPENTGDIDPGNGSGWSSSNSQARFYYFRSKLAKYFDAQANSNLADLQDCVTTQSNCIDLLEGMFLYIHSSNGNPKVKIELNCMAKSMSCNESDGSCNFTPFGGFDELDNINNGHIDWALDYNGECLSEFFKHPICELIEKGATGDQINQVIYAYRHALGELNPGGQNGANNADDYGEYTVCDVNELTDNILDGSPSLITILPDDWSSKWDDIYIPCSEIIINNTPFIGKRFIQFEVPFKAIALCIPGPAGDDEKVIALILRSLHLQVEINFPHSFMQNNIFDYETLQTKFATLISEAINIERGIFGTVDCDNFLSTRLQFRNNVKTYFDLNKTSYDHFGPSEGNAITLNLSFTVDIPGHSPNFIDPVFYASSLNCNN